MAELTSDELRETVRARYADAATSSTGCCGSERTHHRRAGGDCSAPRCTAPTPTPCRRRLVLASLGCGNPTAMAALEPGDVVLDLGSGGGIDVLISARRVAPGGTAYGLDMTDEMLDLAKRNQAKAGVTNVHWLKGHIEAIPLPANTVDVVLSNCVINLSTDKPQVLRETARVLKPGGRLAVSDVIADPDMDDATRVRHAAVRRLHRRRAHPRRVRDLPRGGRADRHRDHRDPPRSRPRRLGDHPRPKARLSANAPTPREIRRGSNPTTGLP